MKNTPYDPNHPQADWSGFVPPPNSRKHFTTPSAAPPAAMRVQITSLNEEAYGPSQNAPTDEWSRPGRKRILSSSSLLNKDTFSLIGGPIPIHDPNTICSNSWETETQSFMKKCGTKVGQLTDTGRAMHVSGVKKTVPSFDKEGRGFDLEHAKKIRDENPYTLNDGKENQIVMERKNDGEDPNDLIGYRSYRGGGSFLTGLAKEIAGNLESRTFVSSAPYATDGNLPTDPYEIKEEEEGGGTVRRRKDLLLENYSSTVPGYTGKRTSFN